jgi:ABC-type antimicrobial peptide transport system permease subunit
MSRTIFFITNSLKGIVRNRRRYILLGFIVFAVSAVVIGSFLLSGAANDFVSEHKTEIDSYDTGYYAAEIKPVESIFFFSNIIIISFGFLGVITLVFITMLLFNDRIYEVGILYSIGMNKIYIYFSLLFETVVFLLVVIIAGILTAAGTLYVFFSSGIIADLRAYMVLDYKSFIIVICASSVLILIPSFMLLAKIVKSSPLTLLKNKNL